ncbi:uncharacterized protein LOC141682407 [Apium graveolens]|uniref:uncharacterized protein LOC141682407 n=1 Tax=Apium graveolens TaxID=4045 RepID=UPI003D79DC2A
MMMFLESIDCDYLDIINDGPPYPEKLVPLTPIVPGHCIRNERSEWSAEEKAVRLKDANIRNILHNSLDIVMSNRVIACKTANQILDALDTQCQGTLAIKKNKRYVLIQEYEQFEAKFDESLTNTYD